MKELFKAKGSVIERRDKYVIRVRWNDENGDQQTREFSTKLKLSGHHKRQAEKMMEDRVKEFQKELDLEREKKELLHSMPMIQKPFLPALETVLENTIRKNVRENTYYEYYSSYKRYIKSWAGFQNITVGEVTPELLDDFRDDWLSKGLSSNTLRKVLTILRQFFKDCCYRHSLPSNPFTQFRPPKAEKFQEQKFLTTAELKKLLAAVQGTPIEAPIRLAAELGLRRSEVCGLRWKDVDFERRQIHICHTAVSVGSKIVRKDATKSSSSDRYLPLSPQMEEYLRDLKARQEEYRVVCGSSYRESGYVACRCDGEPLDPQFIYKNFKRLLKKSGLPDIRLHDLRHSTAALLVGSNCSLYEVQKFLGHSESRTTEIYAHLADGPMRTMSSLIGNALHGEEPNK